MAASASPKQANPLSESPWLWIACFSAMGLVALVAVNTKFARRESDIEQRFRARQLSVRSSSGDEAPAELADDRPHGRAVPGDNIVGLGPLAIVLLLLLAVSITALGLRLLKS